MEIPASLAKTRAAVAEMLHLPGNLGIELQDLLLPTSPPTEGLLVFVDGLAAPELVRTWILEPLGRTDLALFGRGSSLLEALQARLHLPGLRRVGTLPEAIQGILEGAAVLFLDGERAAILVDTSEAVKHASAQSQSGAPVKEIFSRDLRTNIALIRKRLRDPALIAHAVDLPRQRSAGTAVVYLQGRPENDLLQRLEDGLKQWAGEEAFQRGLAPGMRGKLGLIPRMLTTQSPDKVATLLDAGYVVVLMDRLPNGYVAPVTFAAMLLAPSDVAMTRPISKILRTVRALLAMFVLVAGALVIALLNYHQEMMPTSFLFSMASVREQSPFPIVLEVLLLELLQEVIREAAYHLPLRLTPGTTMIAGNLLVLLMAQAGLVGTLPAAVSIGTAFIVYGHLQYEVIYLSRPWRFVLMIGASIYGFFGIATMLFVMAVYLLSAESFGVPFIGETGVGFNAPDRVSSRRKGGDLRVKPGAVR